MLYTPRMRVLAALFAVTLAGASVCSAQIPQGLKPLFFGFSSGTAEAVPFRLPQKVYLWDSF